MHLHFCLSGNSPLLILSHSFAAEQINRNPSVVLTANDHITRNASGHILLPTAEVIRVLRSGAFRLPDEDRSGIRPVFGSHVLKYVNDVVIYDQETGSPADRFGSEPFRFRGRYAMELPRFDHWMARGTMTIPATLDDEALRKALDMCANIGIGPKGPRNSGPWGVFTVTEWRVELPACRTSRERRVEA